MSWNNGQWVRLQQHSDMELIMASVAVENIFMEAAENFLLHRNGHVGALIEGMETPAQLNKYRQERDLLVNTGKVDERSLRMEAINLLIRR